MTPEYPIGVPHSVIGKGTSIESGTGARSLKIRVLSGSMTMLVSSGLVGALNLVYNLALAHALGADRFGHASVVYTVLMLLSAVTLSFQLLCSKFVAKTESLSEKIAIYRFLHRRAFGFGLGVSLLLAYSSVLISKYLNLPTRNYILLLATGIVFFIPLGVRRGLMQGMYDFRNLAFNFVLEVIVKLGGAIALIWVGYGVSGVIVAIVASIVVAYIFSKPRTTITQSQTSSLPAALGEGIQAIVFFVGQVIINNLDIILVKHFFSATDAGIYAAVALVGRVVYMLSWSVVSSMVPFSAAALSEKQDGRTVLGTALLMVVLIASLFTLGVGLAPPHLWHVILGTGFPLTGNGSYTALLVLYAATTGIYSLAVVLMSYEITRKIGNVSWLQLGFSGAIIAGIYMMHGTLHDVVLVQTVLMTLLLLMVSIPFLRVEILRKTSVSVAPFLPGSVMKIRRVTEDEAISEFLRSEFYQTEFVSYQETFRDIVHHPDLSNASDNRLRRALLYRRRGRLWQELPADTQWWEIELGPSDLHRIRVFPRNEWRKHANGTYLLLDVAESVHGASLSQSDDAFVRKLCTMSEELENRHTAPQESGAVLLIGIDESLPLTIIEGNHRMTAATMISPQDARLRFRFLCGFSPRMAECCWYRTNLSTLWRYARNTISYVFENHQVVIDEALRNKLAEAPGNQAGVA